MKLKSVVLTTAVAAALAVSGPAFAAPQSCADNPNGCKSDTTEVKDAGASPGFDTTETQRGNTGAKGTESTETSVCTGPSGKVLDPSHPQCS